MPSSRAGTLKTKPGYGNKRAATLASCFSDVIKLLKRQHSEDCTDTLNHADSNSLAILVPKIKTLWKTIQHSVIKLTGDEEHSFNTFTENFVRNTISCLQALKKLLRSPIDDTRSIIWSRLSMRFMYIHEELNAFFPCGTPIKEYRCSIPEANEWWNNSFKGCLAVSWPQFVMRFGNYFDFRNNEKITKLHDTINFASEFYVSKFAWDLFTRLFAPWDRLVEAWTIIVCEHPGYMPWMTFADMHRLMCHYRLFPGTYAFRTSCTKVGTWAVAYINSNGRIVQCICERKNLADFLDEGIRKRLLSKPVRAEENADMSGLTQLNSTYRVAMDKLATYSSRSSFMSCGVCFAGVKEIKMEPCHHLLCEDCADQWLKVAQTCPFCRTPVESSKRVKIEFEQPDNDDDDSESEQKRHSSSSEKTTEYMEADESSRPSSRKNSNRPRRDQALPPSPVKTTFKAFRQDSLDRAKSPTPINKYEYLKGRRDFALPPRPEISEANNDVREKQPSIGLNKLQSDVVSTSDAAPRDSDINFSDESITISISRSNMEQRDSGAVLSDDSVTVRENSEPHDDHLSNKTIKPKSEELNEPDLDENEIQRLIASGWNKQDVERAMRVSNGDTGLARRILEEFVKFIKL